MNQKAKPIVNPDFVTKVNEGGVKQVIQDKKIIANEMNRQFTEMGAKLAANLNNTEAKFSDYLQFPNPNHDRMIITAITECEVLELINELDVNKSVGIDEIPPKIVKWAAPILAPILTLVFNKCILSGVYPDSLKIARVIPIFKGGDKNDISAYRPISILTQIWIST